MKKTIAEQAAEKNIPMADLLGKSAAILRGLGFEIDPSVPDHVVLAEDTEDLPIDVSSFGRRTGYHWNVTEVAVIQGLAREMAREIDREILSSMFAVAAPAEPDSE